MNIHKSLRLPAAWSALLVFLFALIAWAGDGWTQWGGVKRDFRVSSAKLADEWPAKGPKKLWNRPLGDGYSAIVSDGKSLYTMYSVRDEKDPEKLKGDEFIVALDAKTGKTLWEHKYPAPWTKKLEMEFGPGPNATPLIVGGRLLAIGVTGKLHCLDCNTGSVLWSHDLLAEYKEDIPSRGYSSSPIAYKDTVILPVGGKGHGLVAFRIDDGKEAWKNQDFIASPSSPLLITVNGQEQLVVFMGGGAAGLNPATGELYWSHPHPTQFGANISTPVWNAKSNELFISSAYGMGSRMLKLTQKDGKTTVKELWFNPKVKIHFGNAVRVGDYVYGSSGDMSALHFMAVKADNGEIAWRQKGIKGNCLYADGKLIILDESGKLMLARPEKTELDVISQADMFDRVAWTVPTLVDKTLFVRDRKSIMALDLGA